MRQSVVVRITFFTAGSQGAGHVVRACALQRALVRQGCDHVTLTVVAPPSPFLHLVGESARPVNIDVDALRDPDRAAGSDLARAIADSAPDVVVIDVFWVPLVFVPLPCPAWLLLRSVPPAWLVGPKEARFDEARYQRVLAIEPAPLLQRFEQLDPIVVVDRGDRGSRADLARACGRADGAEPLRVIVRGGLATDVDVLSTAAAGLHPGPWHHLDLHQAHAPFPAAPLLTAADAVLAAPGYNTFWEARVLGFAERTTWVPIRRALDDASWRAGLADAVVPRANGADTLITLVMRG
jgi:hypothetical protein